MATDISGTRSVYNTLSTVVVDTVTLQGHWAAVEISNREAFGGASLWVTAGKSGDTLPTPAALANETFEVPAGGSLVIEMYNGASVNPQVKILGSGNKYGVVGLTASHNLRGIVVPA